MHLFLGYNMGIRILYNVKYTTYIICGLFFFFFFWSRYRTIFYALYLRSVLTNDCITRSIKSNNQHST